MLKILVPVKRVPDPAIKLHLDNSKPALNGVRMVLNPYDEVALEEAVRSKEAGQASEVIALTIGTPECEETLRTALALGADRAIRIDSTGNESPLSVAQALADFAKSEGISLILCGLQSSDEESAQVGPMTAALLSWPFASVVSALYWQEGEYPLRIESQDEAGMTWQELQLPAVLTASLQLNTPRFARLPAIVAAKRKPVTVIERETVAATPNNRQFSLPPERPAITMLRNVNEIAALIEPFMKDRA